MIYAIGKARIQHADTGKIYEISSDKGGLIILEFSRTRKEEVKKYSARIEHSELGKLNWEVWQDPVGILHHHETNVGTHKLLEDFNFGIEEEIPDEDEEAYEDYERQEKIDELVTWFKENYEDPDIELPYDEASKSYIWLYGGPFDAREKLEENFSGDLEDIIEGAVEEIQSYGVYEWSPIAGTNDYEDIQFEVDEAIIEYHIKDIDKKLNKIIDQAPETKTDPAFTFGNDNLFHITLPPDNQPVDSQDELLDELRTVIDDLLESLVGANFHQDMIPIIERYKEAISGNEISISRLYGRGIRLDNVVQAIKRGIEAKEQPSLPLNTESNLETALEIHGSYIMSSAEGQRLVQDAVTYRQSPEQTEEFKKASKQLANIITESRNLFGEDVREHVRDVLMDIAQGQHPERSNQSAGKTLTNMVSGILVWIKNTSTQAIYGILLDAFVKNAKGAVEIAIGTAAINMALGTLINIAPLLLILAATLAGELSWLASAAHLLESIRLKIKSD